MEAQIKKWRVKIMNKPDERSVTYKVEGKDFEEAVANAFRRLGDYSPQDFFVVDVKEAK